MKGLQGFFYQEAIKGFFKIFFSIKSLVTLKYCLDFNSILTVATTLINIHALSHLSLFTCDRLHFYLSLSVTVTKPSVPTLI